MTQDDISRVASEVSKNLMVCQKDILTLEEAALYLGISPSSLYKLTSARKIPYSKPNGKRCFFRRADIESWMMSNTFDATDTIQ